MGPVIAVLFKNRLARFAAGIFLALFIVAIDQWTKALVVKSTLAESPMALTSFFNLVYVENKGAAFGILAGIRNNGDFAVIGDIGHYRFGRIFMAECAAAG